MLNLLVRMSFFNQNTNCKDFRMMTSKQVADCIQKKINIRNQSLLRSLGKIAEEAFTQIINDFDGSYIPSQLSVCIPLGVIPYSLAKAYFEGYGYEVKEFRDEKIIVSTLET